MALAKQNAGKPREAAALYSEIVKSDPAHAFSYHNLGLIELDSGNPGAALPLIWHASQLAPALAEAHNSLGNVYLRLGRTDEAIAAFRKAMETDRTSAIFHFNLANALMGVERNAEAEVEFLEALRINPNWAEVHNNYGNALRSLKRPEDARREFKRAIELRPDLALAYNNAGNLDRDAGDVAAAEHNYREAMRVDPGLAISYFNLGNVLRETGRIGEAATNFRKAIDLNPLHADAYRHLVQVEKIGVDDGLVHYMQSRYENPLVSDSDRVHFGFALGRVFDQAKQWDRAFEYFQTANRLHRKTFAYDIRSEGNILRGIRRVFSADRAAKLPSSGIADDTPVFIVGMIRSGTTLMEQILASHRDVEGGGELSFVQNIVNELRQRTGKPYPDCVEGITGDELRAAGESYLQQVRQLCGDKPLRITDKMPQNFLYLGLISRMLPAARFIYMKRDPRDVALSAYSILFTDAHPYAYDLTEFGQYYRFSEEVMEHWRSLMPSQICLVNYEEMVEDLEPTVRRVLDFCGLPFDPACLDFHSTQRNVATASASQVREKLNANSIGRWKPYDRHLRDLKKALAANQ
ncbi:MAG: sulfotransferase [Rhizobiales bacterium]|nr:sulfotransferase [Hyphomicrobiales bacterium]